MAKGTTFLARRDLGGLKPIDEIGEAAIRRLPLDKIVEVTVVSKRNLELHRLYWVLLGIIFHNLPEAIKENYAGVESFHKKMKVFCGVGEDWEVEKDFLSPSGRMIRAGSIVIEQGSIAFGAMDDLEFIRFFENVCLVAIKVWLPTVTIQALRDEVERITGGDTPEKVVARLRERREKIEEAGLAS